MCAGDSDVNGVAAAIKTAIAHNRSGIFGAIGAFESFLVKWYKPIKNRAIKNMRIIRLGVVGIDENLKV